MNKTRSISAVVITFNEIANIERCILALKQVCDEVVLVDSHSDDGTAEKALEMGCEVHDTDWKGYSATKNLGNQLASNNWILSIDADECLSDDLIQSIQNLKLNDNEVYILQRLTNYCGQWIKHAGWYPDRKPRLFNRKWGQWKGEHVHEQLEYPNVKKEVVLSGHLLHYSYSTFNEHIAREKKYAKLAATRDRNKRYNWFYSRMSMIFKFLRMYIFKAGFLEGKKGLQLCIISSKGKIWKYDYYKELSS